MDLSGILHYFYFDEPKGTGTDKDDNFSGCLKESGLPDFFRTVKRFSFFVVFTICTKTQSIMKRQAFPFRPCLIALFFGAFFFLMPAISQAQVADKVEDAADRAENKRDRLENKRDRKENKRDRKEDRRDAREDVRDAKHDGGIRDKKEDVRDAREDVRDANEDVRDRKENKRDRKENKRDRKENKRDRKN
jgi:hypothetical protein